jgi:hypothetical protein
MGEPSGQDQVRGYVEQKIQEAISSGAFDDLPGKGKPLELNDWTDVDPAMRLVFHLLQNAGMAPAWLEKQKEVRVEIMQVRSTLRRSLKHPIDHIKRDAEQQFKAECERLNGIIQSVNLEAPAISLHLRLLNCERELALAKAGLNTKEDQP